MHINRRTFIKFATGAIALAAGANALNSMNLFKGSRPNIVLFIVDDLRYGMFSHANHPVLKTPHIDRLAHDGIAFHNAFVTTPICPTSRASILTGNYALKHTVYQFNKSLSADTTTFLQLFKNNGYNIGYVGKWGVGEPTKNILDFARITDERKLSEGLFWVKRQGRRIHLTDVTTGDAKEFLHRQNDKKPFILVVSYNAVHGPFTPSRRLLDLYADARVPAYNKGDEDRVPEMVKDSVNREIYQNRTKNQANYEKYVRKYFSLIAGVDESIGSILHLLDKKQIYDKTGFVFTSDNGFMLGDHGLFGKAEMYDASLRVPMIAKPPTTYATAWDTVAPDKLVLNIDVPAMLLGMSGIRPVAMDGQNMLEPDNDRQGFYCEFIQNRPKLNNCEGYRDRQYKYMRYYKDDRVEERFFDLVNDPDELQPLDLQQNAELLTVYRQHMQQEKAKLSTL